MPMSGYTKLFNSILASTIWRSSDTTRIVWITLLAMCDKDGIAEGSIPGLADLARVSIEDCETALDELMAPDSYSRTSEHEGRRIEILDGVGWKLLNHAKYRMKMSEDERREYNRRKQAEHRAKQKEDESKAVNDSQTTSMTVNDSQSQSAMSAHTDTDTKADKKKRVGANAPDVVQVFEYWQTTCNHLQSKLDNKRRKFIEDRLRQFDVETLCRAIDGCKASAWHQGHNPHGKDYDAIGLIFRDAEHVEEFLGYLTAVPQKAKNTYSTDKELDDILLPCIP